MGVRDAARCRRCDFREEAFFCATHVAKLKKSADGRAQKKANKV